MERAASRVKGRALAAALCLGAVWPACERWHEPAPLRNVVLIVVDTLRPDHLRAYGYHRETAPTISRLAAEGSLCDGISPTSWTKPAVASILTGLHPLRHGATGARDPMPAEVETLAERLSRHGYRTLGVVANAWLGRAAGFAQGFGGYYSMSEDLGGGMFSTAAEVNAALLPKLRELEPPYFLYVHYLDPHAPYAPARDYAARPLRGRLAARPRGVDIMELRMGEVLQRPEELLADSLDLYDGEIRQVDASLTALLGELERLGLARGTLTIVTSDHGEEFQEHGRMGHGQSLYEEVVRVPLLFHAPGAIAAGTRLGTTSLMDIFPTVLALLDLGAPPRLDGESRAAAMRLPAAAPSRAPDHVPAQPALLHLDLDNTGNAAVLQGGQALALRDERFKLVLAADPRRKLLFELSTDPGERLNRFADPPMHAELTARVEQLAKAYNDLMRRAVPRRRVLMERQEAMAALGYVGGSTGPDERRLPGRVRPADLHPGGFLGWEP